MLAMAVSLFAIPNSNAQTGLIMNLPGEEGSPHLVVIHAEVDIDLNGGPGPDQNVSLWVRYPGRSAFTYIDTYLTRSNGDLDVYDFDFNETGDFALKWAYPPDSPYYPEESNVEIARVVLEIRYPSYAVIGATPNPVGVNQEVLFAVGITQQKQQAHEGWEDLWITIERPDNKTDKIENIMTDSTGLTGRVYIPDIEGTHYVQTHFPEQKYNGITYEASESEVLELVVQAESIPFYPAAPLPTEYWTRPIDPQLREWSPIAGSWLVDTPENYFAPYNDDAPETAHVLWTKPHTIGGLVGGSLLYDSWDADDLEEYSEHSFEIGDAYEGKWDNRYIVAGLLFYGKRAVPEQYQEIACVDLHTGEELWCKDLMDGETIDFCQLMYWDTYDYHGVYDYLWITRGRDWHAFDCWTGDWVYTMEDMPSGTRVYGPKGEILLYNINTNAGYMTLWNSSNVPTLYASQSLGSMGRGQWRPYGKTVDATGPCIVSEQTPFGISGYQWNVSIPTNLPGSVRQVWAMDKAVGSSVGTTAVTVWGIDLHEGSEGNLLFTNTWTPPSEWAEGGLSISNGAYSSIDELLTLRSKEDRVRYGFSLETGEYLWTTEPLGNLDHLMGGFAGESGAIAYGKFFSGTVSGTIKAFDVETGELAWSYDAYDPLSEILWSNNWPMCYLFFADRKMYIATTEHSPVDPRPRGGPFVCLDVDTGEVVFRVDGMFRNTVWGGRAIIGDSIIVTQDTYDQRVYAIGKGPTQTTVSAPDIGVPFGTNVLVKGMVTDISPGTNEDALKMRFPNGVPAVSDANQSDWMLYVYKQFARPTDIVGVDVTLSVLDPNNNCYEVATTTSDASGFFSAEFEPEVPGKYTIVATFEGSKAYYGSFAETAITVEEAPAATPVPTPEPESVADLYFVPMSIGMIIAIIVVGLVLVLMLRKR